MTTNSAYYTFTNIVYIRNVDGKLFEEIINILLAAANLPHGMVIGLSTGEPFIITFSSHYIDISLPQQYNG